MHPIPVEFAGLVAYLLDEVVKFEGQKKAFWA
jgi:hypothetical protein